MQRKRAGGFTLIELSIVLVIIGIIVGSVLVGQELIRTAEMRAMLSQIDKFNSAVHTFQGKYGAIPGDMDNVTALRFGFASRPSTAGQGDGNGLLDGEDTVFPSYVQCSGETGMFWSDLTYANGMNLNLIEGSFGSNGVMPSFTSLASPSSTQIGLCFPAAKVGLNNYIYVYETGGYNYFGIVGIPSGSVVAGVLSGVPATPLLQTYLIDKKMDDGLPLMGEAQINYVSGGHALSQSNVAGSTATTCMDSNVSGGLGYYGSVYALNYPSNGNGASGICALSLRFQ